MDTFSQVTQQICQKGRRGALMISIDCTHPDLEKFITIKTDLDKVNFANISVRVSDEFMKAVESDADWELFFERPETGEKITKIVKAKDIFELLCKTNWDYAEPGILFWDNINGYHLQSEVEEFSYAGTNPCLVGETLISTTKGEIPIQDLVGQTPDVYCMDENGNLTIQQATKVWLTRKNAQIITVHTKRGTIKCTPNHLIHTRNRGWIEAQNLKHGDKITGLNRQMKGEKHLFVGLSGGKYFTEHRFVAGYYYDIENKDIHHKDGNTFNNSIDNLEILSHSEHSALTNTDRHINPLRNELGQFVAKPIKKKRFAINQNIGRGTNWFVEKVEWETQTQDVYDMTIPTYHNFIANRMVVHNCAEEPLPASGSCLLGSLNLSAFVCDNGMFNTTEFGRCVELAVRALNKVQEEGMYKHPLKSQIDCAHDWKAIGMGVMGIADMLIKMEITYGSQEAIEMCDNIGRIMARIAIKTSADMAKFNGAYPKWNAKVCDSKFYKAHIGKNEDIDKTVNTYGMANSQLLTIAPTGLNIGSV